MLPQSTLLRNKKIMKSSKISIRLIILSQLFIFSSFVQADDVDDIMNVVQSWAELENDLESQAKLIREDRVQITGSVRQSNQAKNLEVQIASHNARVNHEGGAAELIVRIESPLVKIYDNTAVISFIRLVNAIPHDGMPSSPSSAWATMVLVKERNEWKIAHHHMSPIGT